MVEDGTRSTAIMDPFFAAAADQPKLGTLGQRFKAEGQPMQSPPLAETRRSRRVPEASPILVAIASEDYQVQHRAVAMDRSRHGLGIRTRLELAPGETIVIFLQDGRHSQTAPARVVWVRELKSKAGCFAGLECLSLSAA